MQSRFDEIRRHYWWKSSPVPRSVKSFLPQDDMKISWIGFRFPVEEEEQKKFAMYSSERHRSKTLLAPAVKEPYKSTAGKTCDTEINALLPLEFYSQHSREGDMVADFMCGSGSAALAAASSGRSSISIDISAEMVSQITHGSHSRIVHCNVCVPIDLPHKNLLPCPSCYVFMSCVFLKYYMC